MKTKKTRENRECYVCKFVIEKGEQYGQKSVLMGYMASWGHSKDCSCCGGVLPPIEVAPWAYTPYRTKVPICTNCIED